MLPLDSARWSQLAQAYGSAEDVPRLIGALECLASPRERAEIWFAIWSLLCHERVVFTASYAAAPHLLDLAARFSGAERAQGVQLVAYIEVYRHEEGAPAIPDDLVASYAAAIARIPDVVRDAAAEPWDGAVARALAGALLVAQRQPRLGLALMELDLEDPRAGADP